MDLAEQTGIHENYVSDLELGRKEICLRMLAAVTRSFNIVPADILKGSSDDPGYSSHIEPLRMTCVLVQRF